MSEFKPGQVVTVVSLGRIRKIIRIDADRALCKAFTTGQEDWFPLSDLTPNDGSPMRPVIR